MLEGRYLGREGAWEARYFGKEGEWEACCVGGKIFRKGRGRGGKLCWREDV